DLVDHEAGDLGDEGPEGAEAGLSVPQIGHLVLDERVVEDLEGGELRVGLGHRWAQGIASHPVAPGPESHPRRVENGIRAGNRAGGLDGTGEAGTLCGPRRSGRTAM